MNSILRIEDWTEHHYPRAIDFLRIALGLILIYRGFSFASHEEVIHSMILQSKIQYLTFMAAQYLILAHIGGGILIASGILTRLGTIINLPVLIAAVFFINMPQGFTPVNTELVLSIIVLTLLLLFLFYGAGEFSVEHFIKTHKDIW